MGIVDTCQTDKSILQYVTESGLIQNTSIDISSMASKQLETLNFSSVADFDFK